MMRMIFVIVLNRRINSNPTLRHTHYYKFDDTTKRYIQRERESLVNFVSFFLFFSIKIRCHTMHIISSYISIIFLVLLFQFSFYYNGITQREKKENKFIQKNEKEETGEQHLYACIVVFFLHIL
jgi:hypothetical protein